MTTLEMVERLQERADVSLEEAKAALDEADGDLLDALILLERQGKTTGPAKGGAYSDKSETHEEGADGAQNAQSGAETFRDAMRKVGKLLANLFEKGNTNYIDAIHHDKTELSCPVTVFIVLLIIGFWGVIPLMIVGLFFNWKYRFRGADLGRDDINGVIEKAENAAENLKHSVTEGK
ncbi:MAG: ubiquitin [Oscillospiraceae bacterium]|jgi:hypothetical protein|nr:ubiquitin [Oscillospiraceae bacterium]